jgi:pimeloyl-ACP methyl ester carboxylesterase
MPTRRPVRRARALGVAAIFAAAATLLAGCYSGDLFGSEPSSTPVATADGAFADYLNQTVDWSPCATGFECATIQAPMNWEDEADTRSVGLAATRHIATGSDRIGTLFVNPGGPGGSGVDFVQENLDYFLSPDVVASYDVEGWDPRGSGRSAGVSCYTDPSDISDFLYFVPTVDPAADPDGWVEEQLATGRDYAETCEQNTGEVLEFIDTLSTVRDLELLRALSGDSQLHYLGYSYGTAIGSIYVDEYPDKVGRVVLDGVVDRSSSLADLSVGQQGGFELALTHFVEACPGFEDCPLTGDPAVDLPRIHALLEDFQANPVSDGSSASAGRAMTGQSLKTGILQALYSETLWPNLSTLFAQVFSSSPSTDVAWQLADMYNDFTPGVGFSSNLQDALWAIYCVDYPVDTDQAVLDDTQARLEAAAPTLTLDLPPTPDVACSQWPYSYRGGQHQTLTGKGAAPVLIVSTTGDPATPYEEGVKLADDLESGVLVTFDGEGHTAYSAYGNACIVDTVDAYLLNGTVPEDGTWCQG